MLADIEHCTAQAHNIRCTAPGQNHQDSVESLACCTRRDGTDTDWPGADSDGDVAHDSGQLQPGADKHVPSANERLETPDGEAEEGEREDTGNEAEEKLILKIKSNLHTEGLKLRIGVTQPLHRLFNRYQEQGHGEGWLPEGAKVTFKFDGEAINGDGTPGSLDMEDEDVVDACW